MWVTKKLYFLECGGVDVKNILASWVSDEVGVEKYF
jgi:hypothetical protein